jgi:Bcr/CflA subfamily drug resistance transporter
MSSRALQTLCVILTAFATLAATDMFLPSLPSLTEYFGATEEDIQLAMPIYLTGAVMLSPFLGILSDHHGSKPILLLGIGVFLIGTLLCMYSTSLSFFLTARFIQGAGSIVSPVVGWALIQDLYPGDEGAKALSLFGSVAAISPIIAPGLGGYIHTFFGWQGNFIAIFLIGAITFFMFTMIRFDKKNNRGNEKLSVIKTFKTYKTILKNKTFLLYISFYCLVSVGEWTYLTVIPFYYENTLNLTPDVFGVYISSSAFFIVMGTLITPVLLNWIQFEKTLYIGIIFTLIGSGALLLISFLFPHSALFIIFFAGVYLCGKSVIWAPTTSRALQEFDEMRASASAARGLILMSSFAIGGYIGSIANDKSMFQTSLCMLLMALACLFLNVKRGSRL